MNPNDIQPIKNTISMDAGESALREDPTPMLITMLAQQAVLPRQLDEGIYAILDADGAVQVVETPGHQQRRILEWEIENANQPTRVDRKVTVLDVPSFLAYLDQYTDDDGEGVGLVSINPTDGQVVGHLEVWADIDRRKITGILDGLYGWRDHRATLQLQTSREWKEWAEVDGKLLRQDQFAQFIEDHLSTIAEPAGAKLLDICQTLQAHTSVAFKSQTILANGQRQLRYEETVDARAGQKGDLTIPGELTLVLRPFQGSVGVPITARFRFQIRDGVLLLGVKLAEPEAALEDAFNAVVREVADGLPIPVLHGQH